MAGSYGASSTKREIKDRMGQRPLCITWELFREAHFVNFPIVWDTSSIKELILSSLLIFRVHGTLQMVLASTTKLLKTYKMSNGRICSSQGECIMIKGLIQEEDIRQSVSSVQLLSHVRLCNPMDCRMPGFLVHHQLPELTQTHVHRAGDAIQPSHHLSFPSPPAFSLFQHQDLFK